ncbi:MAG TPA: hypothetical protein VNQ77_13910 [Frankiaceae bacterium]|nr:hypothetical protein [Frankiaceae bacterium]
MPPAPTVAGNHQATEKELPIEASISPACVPAGGLATLTVKTLPKTTLAFVAVYNGEKSGAAPPWGEGYGGNDKGEASADGSWTISWTVTPNAPHGPARVILAAGKNGKQRAINVPFSVGGREAGGCGT